MANKILKKRSGKELIKLKNKSFLKLNKRKILFSKHYDYNLNYKNILLVNSFPIIKNTKLKADIRKILIKNKINLFANSLLEVFILKKKNYFKYFSQELNNFYGFLWKKNKEKAYHIISLSKKKNKNWYKINPYCFFFYGDTDDIYIKKNIPLKYKNKSIPGLLKKNKKDLNVFFKKKNYITIIRYKQKNLVFKKGT